MKTYYSSLFKGDCHVTTPFNLKTHPAIDLGNYKVHNKIYSPNKLGKGVCTKITDSYTYQGNLYKDVRTTWIAYAKDELCLVHGEPKMQPLKVGDKVKVGQFIYVTGARGYAFGDHLHCQLKHKGVLVDPTPYVLNDKVTPVAVPTPTPIETPMTPTPAPTPVPVPSEPTTNDSDKWKGMYDELYAKINDPESGYIKQLNDRDLALKTKTQNILALNNQLLLCERWQPLIDFLNRVFPSKE
jgi:hypothetical protein